MVVMKVFSLGGPAFLFDLQVILDNYTLSPSNLLNDCTVLRSMGHKDNIMRIL